MPSVQKRTPSKRPRKARLAAHARPRDPLGEEFGKRLTAHLNELRDEHGRPWSNGKLARELQKARELDSPPTRTVGLWRRGERLPAADQLADLSRILNVPTDWLLCGLGPKSRDQVNESVTFESACVAFLRRAIAERLDGRTPRRLDALDVSVDCSGLLEALVTEFADHIKRDIESVSARGEAYRRDAKHIPMLLNLEHARIKLEKGETASDEWFRNLDARMASEYTSLAKLHNLGANSPGTFVSLTRRAIARLEQSANDIPVSETYGRLVPLGIGFKSNK